MSLKLESTCSEAAMNLKCLAYNVQRSVNSNHIIQTLKHLLIGVRPNNNGNKHEGFIKAFSFNDSLTSEYGLEVATEVRPVGSTRLICA